MLLSLVEKIPISFGRSFVMAGLIPVLIGWILIQVATGDLIASMQHIMENIDESSTLTPIIIEVILIFIAAGILSGTRESLFYFFQSLPGPFIRPIRRIFMDQQLRKKKGIEKNLALIIFDLRVVDWPVQDFYAPKKGMPGMSAAEDWLQRSQTARKTIDDLATDWTEFEIVGLKDANTILQGLKSLYLNFLTEGKDDAKEELKAWKSLVEGEHKNEIVQILQFVAARFQRDYNLLKPDVESFPAIEFMMPTQLGNIIASVDDYAEKLYGIQTGILWSRISNLMDGEERTRVSHFKLDIQMFMNIAFILGALTIYLFIGAVVSLKYLFLGLKEVDLNDLISGNELFSNGYWEINWPLLLVLVLLPILIFSSNRLMMSSALRFKDMIHILIDLKKSDLLSKLGISVKNAAEEYTVLKTINDAILGKRPLTDIDYSSE